MENKEPFLSRKKCTHAEQKGFFVFIVTLMEIYFVTNCVTNPQVLVLYHTGAHRERPEVFILDNLSNEHEEVMGLNIFRQTCRSVII